MDDEECLPERSSMNTYLQNLGYCDIQVIKNKGGNLIDKFKASLSQLHLPVKVIDKYVIDQIELIISTKLLFEEDFTFVEVLLSNFKVLNNEIPKIMHKDYYISIVIFLGLCLYLVIGYYALVIISFFYAYKCTNYFKRKQFNKQFDKFEIKNLVKVLCHNSGLLKKITDYINIKRDKYLWFQANHTELFKENEEINFYFCSRFKSDFLSITNEMINTLLYSTQQLIKKFPLIDYADIPEHYLCSHFEKNFIFDDPSKLYLLYMLVQSEFLRRIILILIPNLHAVPKNNSKLEKILKETTVKVMKLNKTLQNKFEFAFREGFEKQFELIKLKKSPANYYTKEFISSIHDVTNTFTKILLKCRLMEESLLSGELPQNIEANVVDLQTAIKDCQRNVENSFILLKKANTVSNTVNEVMEQKEETGIKDDEKNKEKCSLEKNSIESQNMTKEGVNLQEEEIATSDDNINKIKVDANLANIIEDDVFEAYISKENQNVDNNVDNWDLEEVLKNNLRKEFSQNVMKELKGRLVEKAKNWKKREMKVLRKKGLINNNNNNNNNEELSNDELDESENETEPKAGSTNDHYEEIYFEKREPLDPEIKKLFSETATNEYEELKNQSYFGSVCKGFLKDLCEKRKLILKSPTAEEEFCLCTDDEELFDDKSSE